jgi:uncharacterized protein (DUF433 family)
MMKESPEAKGSMDSLEQEYGRLLIRREKERGGVRRSPTAHVQLDDEGTAWIDDSGVKVLEVVLDMLAYDMIPEELQLEYPDLNLAQIHAALSFYYDNKKQMDAEIEDRYREIQEMAECENDPVLRARLQALLETAMDFC